MGQHPRLRYATMKPDRITKRKVRFQEVSEYPDEALVMESIYVPKSTLQSLGWSDGDAIEISIGLEG